MYIEILKTISHIVFVFLIGYYSISALQWYSYKLERVFFHYKRYDWHLLFFIIPIFIYYLGGDFFFIYMYVILAPTLYFWYKKLDKKLVFTSRIKRFFLFLALATVFQDLLCLSLEACTKFGVILPIFVSIFISELYEKLVFASFKKEAKKKIDNKKELIIFGITASYGKTSIKNYLYQILSTKYKCYMTPRSVNTLTGIIKGINNDLPEDTEIYIVEAGARQSGDIDEIVKLVNPHYVTVGKIGEQHIEYFKSLENIRNTKMEIINSNRLKKAFIHVSANISPSESIIEFGNEINSINATLDGIIFNARINGKDEEFFAPLLGDFNAINLLATIHLASVKMDLEDIKNAMKNLKPVEHRLQKIEAGGKLIIDDSFNGNLDGMLSSYELVSQYSQRKVILTPGIVESTVKANETLAKKIDEIFDLVIITGKSNSSILSKNITKSEKIILEDKSKMQEILKEHTRAGDLILFSNDTPTFM